MIEYNVFSLSFLYLFSFDFLLLDSYSFPLLSLLDFVHCCNDLPLYLILYSSMSR